MSTISHFYFFIESLIRSESTYTAVTSLFGAEDVAMASRRRQTSMPTPKTLCPVTLEQETLSRI